MTMIEILLLRSVSVQVCCAGRPRQCVGLDSKDSTDGKIALIGRLG